MGGLAAVSTVLALVIQDRTLSADLREAASGRLAGAAAGAGRMSNDHLTAVTQRYVAISTTPEFRANLEVGDSATLAYHAQSLIQRLGASAIAFQSPEGRRVALAGDRRLEQLATEQLATGTPTYLVDADQLYAAA